MAPYIKQEDRKQLDVSNLEPNDAGELNYVISSLISGYLKRKGLKYQNINEVMGVLACVSEEFYRRVGAPYEDAKIKENGDIGYPKV